MFSWLTNIYCALLWIPAKIADLFMLCLNELLQRFLDAVGWLLGLLPAMPALPAPPSTSILGWANWMFPIGPVVALFGVYLGLYLTARIYMAAKKTIERFGPIAGMSKGAIK